MMQLDLQSTSLIIENNFAFMIISTEKGFLLLVYLLRWKSVNYFENYEVGKCTL